MMRAHALWVCVRGICLEEDSDRYKGDAEDGCHGGDEELYFDIRAFHFSG